MKRNQIERGQTSISKFLLMIFLFNILFNKMMFAGNGGPTQPEVVGFKPVGVANNVNHFTGDFTYTIPLLDVEGFPINLNYLGNAGLEEEASWVGLGWNINLGTINRQMRGIPDEFNGTDKLIKKQSIRSNITVGIQLSGNLQKFNNQPIKRLAGLGIGVGLTYNNYTGMGTEMALSPTFSLSKSSAGHLTLGLGLKSSSESGLDISPNVGFQTTLKGIDDKNINISAGIGTSLNSREGVKEIRFHSNFESKVTKGIVLQHGNNFSLHSFLAPSYMPSVGMSMSNELYALSLNGHFHFLGMDGGGSAMGHYSRQYLDGNDDERNLYGYLNLDTAKYDLRGLLDFNREKDVPYNDNTPVIAAPNMTYDLFVVNQPDKSSQFRAFRTNTGILYDGSSESSTRSVSLGGEVGGGNVFQSGVTLNATKGGTWTGKWDDKNNFKNYGDFQNYTKDNLLAENYYFKSVDEFSQVNPDFESKIIDEKPVNIAIMGEEDASYASNVFKDNRNVPYVIKSDISAIASPNSSEKINQRNANFSFLTKSERTRFGFDREIKSYGINSTNFNLNYTTINNDAHKEHHISEITILNEDGRRAIYGIPAYNNYQNDVSFSTKAIPNDEGIVQFYSGENSIDNRSGKDQYFNSERTPGYAHSWLMTALLSSDYQDITGNGVSDDDLGNAYKFNYSRVNGDYKWRIPTTSYGQSANFSEGLLADPLDNKASYTEGSREDWYVHSIESKNMTAIFFITARQDALGGTTTGIDAASKKYKLDSIQLYSKQDLNKGYATAIPIKVVHFVYDYSLCSGVKNRISTGGKLTLKEVYFTYGNNKKGAFNRYKFNYNYNPNYHTKNVDRWANYKDRTQNPNGIHNDYYPYTLQDKNKTNQYAGAWLLTKIDLPSGGDVNVEYESDDYAYVQNKRASYMQPLTGLSARISCNSSLWPLPGYDDPEDCNYASSRIYQDEILVKTLNLYLHFDLPLSVNTREEFAKLYLKDPYNPKFAEKLYFRTRMFLHQYSLDEYVSGYADIDDYGVRNDNGVMKGWIKLKKIQYDAAIEGYHPFAYAGWQVLKNHLPTKSNPYKQLVEGLGPFEVIMALTTLVGNIQELLLGYGSVAETFRYGQNCTPNQTFIRLLKPDNCKLGGGSRVKKITMNDNWQSIAKGDNESAEYGQEYLYKTIDGKDTISSGVAEYEPLIGGEENPNRTPIDYYGPHGLFAPASRHYVEEPICEGLFPSARVGYSNVQVLSINSKNKKFGIGSQNYEFYTAKEFPVRTDRTSLSGDNVKRFSPNFISKFLKIDNRTGIYLSQGYSVETNNMHGKPKGETVLNQEGNPIAKTIFHYHTKLTAEGERVLDNVVPTVDEKKNISLKKMGVEYDFYTDMRNQSTMVYQLDLEVGGGAFIVPVTLPLFIPHFLPFLPSGWMESKFYSSSSMKYMHKKGILNKIEKTKEGSLVTTENKLWDINTGNPLLTSVTNEYDEKLYNLTYPAYWMENGMGYAYKNQGTRFKEVLITKGEVIGTRYNSILTPGDEVILKSIVFAFPAPYENYFRAWVVADPVTGKKYIVNQNGVLINAYVGEMKILRSGKRNLLDANAMSTSMFLNPMGGTTLNLSSLNNIINSSASRYREDWKFIDNARITTLKCINPTLENNYIRTNSNSLFNSKKIDIENWLKP